MTAISWNNDKFVNAVAKFDAARKEESAAMLHSQRAGNLTRHARGAVAECKEDETEESAARKCSQPARNQVDQVKGEINTIFRGGNGWDNNSVPPLAQHTLGITGGAAATMTQHATTFPEGVN